MPYETVICWLQTVMSQPMRRAYATALAYELCHNDAERRVFLHWALQGFKPAWREALLTE
jgi:hypothetical protein